MLLGPALALAQAGGADPVQQYAAVLKETDGLKVYNDLVTRQIATQQETLAAIQAAIEQVPDLEKQLPGLLSRMIDGLEEFINLDIPFLPDERADRVAQLRLLMERADVSDTEKFRRIIEAWQVENEYGSNFSTYVGQIPIDGNNREVDFLQVGRVALLFQTTDEQGITGAWDKRTKSWVMLGSEHRNSVRQALRMARNQIAPELVLLPITPPE